MGFFFKSAIGLGIVYWAMFGPESLSKVKSTSCLASLKTHLRGETSLSSQWQQIACATQVVEGANAMTSSLMPTLRTPTVKKPKTF